MPIVRGFIAHRRWIPPPQSRPRWNRHRTHSVSTNHVMKEENTNMSTKECVDTSDIVHDVVIIGGGPTGLILSNLLSSYNVHSHILFDKRPLKELLKHPQAHFINIRSMEILKSELPDVYHSILRQMPPVNEWECFNFGGAVAACEGTASARRLARVVHPVRHPLRVGQRGDALLLDFDDSSKSSNSSDDACEDALDTTFVSSCRPAHLAQNKFLSLLLQEKSRNSAEWVDCLRYGEEVISISDQNSTLSLSGDTSNVEPSDLPIISVRTSRGQSYRTRYLIAADGVHSFTRKHYDISMTGDNSIQNLINVHFRANDSLSKYLMHRKENQAMLHFIYNSQLVGVFVCHDGNHGEWVLQIPFFPPYQSIEDFDRNRVRDLIWAGLGKYVSEGHTHTNESFNFDILSIRPWTMTSLVANQYLNENKNMALVGDAAHAFPPAGGFGMNTGLQDAHNIAWRLALVLQQRDGFATKEYNYPLGLNSSLPVSSYQTILSRYEKERKTVATQNAALSVRNYRRTLNIAKACYLNAQHPQLLTSILSLPPVNGLPLEFRQGIFKRLVNVAMSPLECLTRGTSSSAAFSFHAQTIQNNVRSILENKGALPLVFPKYELGFSYGVLDGQELVSDADDSHDTAGYFPRLRVGDRMPHVDVDLIMNLSSEVNKHIYDWSRIFETNNNHQLDGNSSVLRFQEVSLTTISSQLRRAVCSTCPLFIILAIGPGMTTSTDLNKAILCIMDVWKVQLISIDVLPSWSNVDETSIHDVRNERESMGNKFLVAVDTQNVLSRLLHQEVIASSPDKVLEQTKNLPDIVEVVNALIVIRPDGHVANIAYFHRNASDAVIQSEQIKQTIDQGLHNALG